MRGRWFCLDVALAVALIVVGGCGRGKEEAQAEGEGLEPRIVTEGPVDAPGRPEGREVAAVGLEEEAGVRWVPHLTVSDLAASTEFYRGLGFAAEADEEEGAGRVELERDGVRLVLVAGEAATAADEEGTAAEGRTAVETTGDPVVLHLVDEAGGATREVRDPDGHRLVISG